ncbi:MAG: hypothetical protein ROO76_10515 [Terriglobia bacterium]|nr:hypothetical protein [Terriglobia bacterium]
MASLYQRYGLVFGDKEAEQVLPKEEFDKKAFQANARRLEERLRSLGLVRRLIKDAQNPVSKGCVPAASADADSKELRPPITAA